jgi:hypothetical protein
MNKFSVLLVLVLLVGLSGLVFAAPNGANVSQVGNSGRAPINLPENNSAIAGNVTELTISGETITQAWQGYFGNVSGVITLENSGGSVMYNWSSNNPSGEVFASNESSVTWAGITCFNLTANASTLEASFGIGANDVDGVNETFSDSAAHDAFAVGGVSFAGGDCPATFVYDDTQVGVDNYFEEVLLSAGVKTVFAALLERDEPGFDNNPHDFEMLVLENGHLGDVGTTPYFFYLELG